MSGEIEPGPEAKEPLATLGSSRDYMIISLKTTPKIEFVTWKGSISYGRTNLKRIHNGRRRLADGELALGLDHPPSSCLPYGSNPDSLRHHRIHGPPAKGPVASFYLDSSSISIGSRTDCEYWFHFERTVTLTPIEPWIIFRLFRCLSGFEIRFA